VIDGERSQLSAALEAARRLGWDLSFVNPGQAGGFLRPPSLRLPAERIPPAAPAGSGRGHRFGLAYNRKQRPAHDNLELLNIPGVGPARRRRLLERFGSLAGVRSASASELATVPGFSARLAERILAHLNGQS
jgi:excinuclease ABC subunit C